MKAMCIVWLAALVILGSILAAVCSGATDEAFDATCRVVTPGGEVGTGTVFAIESGYVYVLTAGHVAWNDGARRFEPTATCEFWLNGQQMEGVGAVLVGAAYTDRCDAAILAVAERSFGGLLPKVIPLASKETRLQPGQVFLTAGCAGGNWATAFRGHAVRDDGLRVEFLPPPADGRSGSALLSADGRQIVGIIEARRTDGVSMGYAVSIAAVHAGLWSGSEKTGCGPRGCFPDQGQPYQYEGGAIGGGIFGYRQQYQSQGLPQGVPAIPYPMAPSGQPALGPTEEITTRLVPVERDLAELKPRVEALEKAAAASGAAVERIETSVASIQPVMQRTETLAANITSVSQQVSSVSTQIQEVAKRPPADPTLPEKVSGVSALVARVQRDLRMVGWANGLLAGLGLPTAGVIGWWFARRTIKRIRAELAGLEAKDVTASSPPIPSAPADDSYRWVADERLRLLEECRKAREAVERQLAAATAKAAELQRQLDAALAKTTDPAELARLRTELASAKGRIVELECQLADRPLEVQTIDSGEGLLRMRQAMERVGSYYPGSRATIKLIEDAYSLIHAGERSS